MNKDSLEYGPYYEHRSSGRNMVHTMNMEPMQYGPYYVNEPSGLWAIVLTWA